MNALNTSANTNSVQFFTSDGHAFGSFKEAAAYAREHIGVTFCRHEGGRAFAKPSTPKIDASELTALVARCDALEAANSKLNAVVDQLVAELEMLKTKRRNAPRKAA